MEQLNEIAAAVRRLETVRQDDKDHVNTKFHEVDLRFSEAGLERERLKTELVRAVNGASDRVLQAVIKQLEGYTPRELHDEQIETLEADVSENKEEAKVLQLRVNKVEKHLIRYAGAIAGTGVGVMAVDKFDLLQKFLELFNV